MGQQAEKKSIKRLALELNKNKGENFIGKLLDLPTLEIDRIPSNIKVLDDAVGGGFPAGKMVEFYGAPSSGKSLISLNIIAQAQKLGMECVYFDVEDSFDPVFASKFGVDTEALYIAKSYVGEEVVDTICSLLEAEPGVIVVDSVAALITQGELDEDMSKQFMAPKGRLLSKGLAKINAINKRTLIIFINQLRATMAMYGPPTTTTGGRALPHYASIRMEVKSGRANDLLRRDDKKTTEVVGQIVNFHVVKNKTFKPYQTGSFKFFYEGCRIE